MCEVAAGHEPGAIRLHCVLASLAGRQLGCTYQTLLDSLLDLLDLDLGEAADLEKMLAVLSVNSLVINPLAIAHWSGPAEAGY
jgi:hypothetical protein